MTKPSYKSEITIKVCTLIITVTYSTRPGLDEPRVRLVTVHVLYTLQLDKLDLSGDTTA